MVPTRGKILAVADEEGTRDLRDLFPDSLLEVTVAYGPKDRDCQGRHKSLDVSQMVELSFGDGQNKSRLYCQLLRSMMADQAAWIRDRSHQRKITEANGRESLAVAVEADRLAHG